MIKIAFKEKDANNQFYRDDNGEWIKTDEEMIDKLWNFWVESEGADRYQDEEGFTVFDYKNLN